MTGTSPPERHAWETLRDMAESSIRLALQDVRAARDLATGVDGPAFWHLQEASSLLSRAGDAVSHAKR